MVSQSLAIKEKRATSTGPIELPKLGGENSATLPGRGFHQLPEKLGDEHAHLPPAGHAQEQRDFAQAEQWYRKSLAIKEKLGNEHGAAGTYHHLGRLAQEQRDFAQAEHWYRKALAIKEKLGDEHGAARTHAEQYTPRIMRNNGPPPLGRIAQEQARLCPGWTMVYGSIVICLRYDDRYHLRMAAQNFALLCPGPTGYPGHPQSPLGKRWPRPAASRERAGVSRMTTLLHRIETLSDADAQRILTTFARNQPGYSDSTLSPELTAALRLEPTSRQPLPVLVTWPVLHCCCSPMTRSIVLSSTL